MMKTLTKMGFSGKDFIKTAQVSVDIPSFTLGSCDIRSYVCHGYKCAILVDFVSICLILEEDHLVFLLYHYFMFSSA